MAQSSDIPCESYRHEITSMKSTILRSIIVALAALVPPLLAEAQGTTFVSNLGGTPAGSSPVGSDSWLGIYFRAGTNAGGYTLETVQLGMTNGLGDPSDFTAMLYSAKPSLLSPQPGNNLGTLSGSLNPVTAGVYDYTPASSLTLTPSTDYFIVLTAGTAVATGSYQWINTTTPPNLNGGWLAGSLFFQSSDGSSWHSASGADPEFAIWARNVPEPCTWALLFTGAWFLFLRRRR